MIYQKGDKVVRNTALSNVEILQLLYDYDMYDATKQELIAGEAFTVNRDYDEERISIQVRTPRDTTVEIPVETLQFLNNILNEGDEL